MALFEKTNVPISVPINETGTTENYSDEIAKIQSLVMNTNRSVSGQVEWTSASSGVTYNTQNYASNSNIYNKGETGLYNLLIYLYGNNPSSENSFILTATNFNEVIANVELANTNVNKVINGTTPAAVATKVGTTTVGNSSTPIYLNGGTPAACTSLSLNTTGSAGSAGTADKLSVNAGTSAVPVYFTGGVPTACGTLSVGTTGNAGTATKLASGKTLKVDLTSSSASSAFDGSANITNIGVAGILPVANGGTGVNNLSNVTVGTATKATKLSNTTAIGGTGVPVYFKSDGTPAVCTTLSLNTTGSSGSCTGNAATATSATTATTATKLSNTSAIGSATQPVYFTNGGVPSAGSTYAGGTKVTLNGTDKGASTASFYAPTGVGTAGQYLRSNGSGAPTWRASVYIRTSGYPDNPVTGDICIHY